MAWDQALSSALKIANKRIDELEKYNLDLANESHNKSNRIKELEEKLQFLVDNDSINDGSIDKEVSQLLFK